MRAHLNTDPHNMLQTVPQKPRAVCRYFGSDNAYRWRPCLFICSVHFMVRVANDTVAARCRIRTKHAESKDKMTPRTQTGTMYPKSRSRILITQKIPLGYGGDSVTTKQGAPKTTQTSSAQDKRNSRPDAFMWSLESSKASITSFQPARCHSELPSSSCSDSGTPSRAK